jgi:hypothetical protein
MFGIATLRAELGLPVYHFLKIACVAAVLAGGVSVGLRLKRPWGSRIRQVLPSAAATVTIAVLASALLPALLRLAVLPWMPAHQPTTHDEFGHLLVAGTLAAGRLANPPHPLWRHFDTIYILQHPAYASVYPIGQGAVLALGKIVTGEPWFGVVFATALMGGAIAWALSMLLPPRWVLAGTLPIVFTYGFQWMETLMGGSFCAFGGALLCGALLRLRKSPSAWMAAVAALGWSIVWFTRPFESILPFLVLSGSIIVFVIRAGPARKEWTLPVITLVLFLSCSGGLTLLHNRAITGSFITLPYRLEQKVDGFPQSLAWQPAVPAPKFRFAAMRDMYFWQLRFKETPLRERVGVEAERTWDFFLTPWFSLPLLLSLLSIRNPMVGAAWALLLSALGVSLLYPFFFNYYLAAYSCVFAFLIVTGLMVLYDWSPRGWRAGPPVALFIILGGMMNLPLGLIPLGRILRNEAPGAAKSRWSIQNQLKGKHGMHVVFVRYGANRDFQFEWVYNDANIDAAPVVWCRSMGPAEDSEVMRYYSNRTFWIVDIEGENPTVAKQVSRYPPQ